MYNYYAPFQRPMGYYSPSIPMGQDVQNYQQAISQPAQANIAPQNPIFQQNSSDMIWVLNETEATSYPVAPNNSVTLWDKERDTVYIKSVNMQGVPSMRILDYSERLAADNSKIAQDVSTNNRGKFVCEKDFKALQEKFDGLQNQLNELKARKTKVAKTNKLEEVDDE